MGLESIHNYYEQLVFERIRQTLAGHQEPIDDQQLVDVACVALNNLPPRYVCHSVDFLSHLSTEEMQDIHSMVDNAILNAAKVVQTRRRAPMR